MSSPMSPETAQKLLDLNAKFYSDFASQWHTSRISPWAAFSQLSTYIPHSARFLDAGCGNGRFGLYLAANNMVDEYVGIDGSQELLDSAAQQVAGTFYQRDLSDPSALTDLGLFDGAACLAVLHHIPREQVRIQVLQAISDQLQVGAYLILSNFRFTVNARMRKKIVEWSEVGLDSAELEPNDYLLNWQRGGYGLRYLNLIDEPALQRLVAPTDLTLVETFYSDGKEGNLNLYGVLQKQGSVDTDKKNL